MAKILPEKSFAPKLNQTAIETSQLHPIPETKTTQKGSFPFACAVAIVFSRKGPSVRPTKCPKN